MSKVSLGRIGRAHGLDGEVGLEGCSLTALELHAIKDFTWRRRGEERALRLATARAAHTRMLVGFEGVHGREAAQALTNGELLVDEARLPDAGPGQVYAYQLVGLDVVTADGRALGTLAEVLHTGAHPIYVVRGERELLLPAIPDVVKQVDLESRAITVVVPAGLEEL